jgi:hypothetical protein
MCRQEKEGYCTRRQAKAEPEEEAPSPWLMRETAADYTPEVGPEYREGHSRSIATSRLQHISKSIRVSSCGTASIHRAQAGR